MYTKPETFYYVWNGEDIDITKVKGPNFTVIVPPSKKKKKSKKCIWVFCYSSIGLNWKTKNLLRLF